MFASAALKLAPPARNLTDGNLYKSRLFQWNALQKKSYHAAGMEQQSSGRRLDARFYIIPTLLKKLVLGLDHRA